LPERSSASANTSCAWPMEDTREPRAVRR
jgi:hypothetical protein